MITFMLFSVVPLNKTLVFNILNYIYNILNLVVKNPFILFFQIWSVVFLANTDTAFLAHLLLLHVLLFLVIKRYHSMIIFSYCKFLILLSLLLTNLFFIGIIQYYKLLQLAYSKITKYWAKIGPNPLHPFNVLLNK